VIAHDLDLEPFSLHRDLIETDLIHLINIQHLALLMNVLLIFNHLYLSGFRWTSCLISVKAVMSSCSIHKFYRIDFIRALLSSISISIETIIQSYQ
jgi:hypothetical protein